MESDRLTAIRGPQHPALPGVSARRLALAVFGTVFLGAMGVSSLPASAYTEKAIVERVADGDSFYIKDAVAPIRVIGIDAPERDTCGYGDAKSALRRLAGNKDVVKLTAAKKSSYSVGNGFERPLRYVYSYEAKRDVSTSLIQTGLAVFNNTVGEHAKEIRYANAAQVASAARLGLFAEGRCGDALSATIQMFVHYNADLNDAQNITGKWVRLVNRGLAPVNLNGWRLRPSNRKYYTIPNVTLSPGQSFVVHSGTGGSYMKDGDYHYSWGRKIDIPDPRTSIFKTGAMCLQDPSENFRAWSYWPCTVNCPSTGLIGKLRITAEQNQEYLDVTNISGEIVDASFTVVETGASVFELPQGNVIAPGASVRIWAQPHGGEYTLNRNSTMMPGRGGSALLRGNDGVTIDTYRW